MKTEGKLFVLAMVFYLVVGAIYGFWSKDETGIVLLLFTGGMALIVAFFALHVSRKVYPRPEDNDDALPEDANPDYGFFPPHSWMPLPLAGSMAIIVLGLVFAVWMVVLGVVLLLFSLVGWVFEYYRGDHAH